MDAETLHREILQRLTKIEQVSADTLAQTTKTNGRVNRLEDWRVTTDRWRWILTGGGIVIAVCLLPIAGWALQTIVALK